MGTITTAGFAAQAPVSVAASARIASAGFGSARIATLDLGVYVPAAMQRGVTGQVCPPAGVAGAVAPMAKETSVSVRTRIAGGDFASFTSGLHIQTSKPRTGSHATGGTG